MKRDRYFCFIFLQALMFSCSAQPNLAEAPGVCSINCAGAHIATTDMKINYHPLDNNEISVDCQDLVNNEAYQGTVPLRFLVEKAAYPHPELPSNKVPGDSASELERPNPLEFSGIEGTPVAGISFEALVLQGHLVGDNPDDERFKYRGIATEKSQWCTDSCGTGSIDITPMCTGANNVIKVLVRSGPIARVFTINALAGTTSTSTETTALIDETTEIEE